MGSSVTPLDWLGFGSSMLGSAASAYGNTYAADRQFQATQETNKQNYQIWKESKDFSREQADTQWEREKEMFNLENKYNSPVEVVKRLKEAGINPAVAMQGSLGSSMSSAASGGSPTIGSTPTAPQMQVPQVGQYLSNIATGVSDASLKASQMLKNIAEARQQGLETKKFEELYNAQIDDYMQELKRKRLENYKLSFETEMITKYGDKLKKAELDSLLEDINNKVLQGDNIRSDTYKKNMEGWLTQLNADEKKAFNEHLDEFVDQALKLGNEKILTERASQNASNASAEHSRVAVGTERAQQYQLSELAKMTKTQRLKVIEDSITLFEDEQGVKMNKVLRSFVRTMMMREMRLLTESTGKHVRQQGADYWNPFRYIGSLLGGSATEVAKKALK